jgi:hypothetical protein
MVETKAAAMGADMENSFQKVSTWLCYLSQESHYSAM